MLRQRERQLGGHVLDLCCFAQEVTHVTSVHRPLTSTTQLQGKGREVGEWEGRTENVEQQVECLVTIAISATGRYCYLSPFYRQEN